MHQTNNEPAPDITPEAPTTPTPSTSEDGGAFGGDSFDVMNILADVEKHIQRIKSAQREHDQELSTLEARFESLKNAEREVEQRRKRVIEERGRLEQVQNALKEERHAFEQECAARRSEFDSQRAALSEEREVIKQQQQEIAERFQGLEKQFTELSALEQEIGKERAALEGEGQAMQARHKQLIEQLDQRQADLDQRDSELSAKCQAMESQEQQLTAEAERMQREVEAFSTRAAEAEAKASEALQRTLEAEAQLESRSKELARLKSELEAARAALGEAKEKAAAQERAFEEEREQASAMMSELEASLNTTTRERDGANASLASQREEHASLAESHARMEELRSQLEQEVAQLSEKLAQRDKSLSESQQKLKLAGQKLAEFSEVLREQATQLDHAASAKVTIRQQEQEIEHLCNELARYRLASDPEVLDRKDQRIAELTEALRQARGQSPGSDDGAVLEHQVLELSTALDDRQLIIEQLQVQLEQAQERAKQSVPAEMLDAGDQSRFAERDAKIGELTAEVHRLEQELSSQADATQHADASSSANAARIESLQQRIRELESAPGRGDDSELVDRLHQMERELEDARAMTTRVAELEEELQHARSTAAKHSGGGGGPSTKQLDEKVHRIRAAAEHLQRRRSRLKRVRQLVEMRKPAGERQSQSTIEQIELAQQSIAEARSALAMSEREMMKRWARGRASVAVSFVAILVGVLAVGSWFIADQFYPAKSTAAVTLEARTRSDEPLTGEDGARWSAWHADMVADHAFRTTLAKRMQERQLPQFGTVDALNSVMKSDVTIDAVKPGEITITMAGHNEEQLTHALDTLASTLATASTRDAGKRTDSARTVIRGERNKAGNTQFAHLTGVKLEDNRLMHSAIIFSAISVVALLCGVGVYTRLVKAKRIFEEEGRLS